MSTYDRMGKVMSQQMARSMLFEDEKRERESLPYSDHHKFPEERTGEALEFQIDMGSVMGLMIDDAAMHDRFSHILNEVGRICRDSWSWYSSDETIMSMVPLSSLGTGSRFKDDDTLMEAPTDLRRMLYINFASRDDAMLVRMTVEDMRSVKNADSGVLPT